MSFKRPVPKINKTPRWVPCIKGVPQLELGVYRSEALAVQQAEGQLPPHQHCWATARQVYYGVTAA